MARIITVGESEGIVEDVSLDALLAVRHSDTQPGSRFWADIEDPDEEEMEQIAEAFGIHPSTVSDCLTRNVPVKWQEFDNYLYIVNHGLNFNEGDDLLETLNLSILVFNDCVLSIHTAPLRSRDMTLDRIRTDHQGKLPSPDWVAFALLDAITDLYGTQVDKLMDEVEALDEEVLAGYMRSEFLEHMGEARRHLAAMRRRLSPKREFLQLLCARDLRLIDPATQIYLRGVLDKVIRGLERIEVARETLITAQSNYLAQISNRMNEVMKTLSIVATVVLPLSFLTGLFGMNVRVPGQDALGVGWFAGLLCFMSVIVFGLLALFRHRKWL